MNDLLMLMISKDGVARVYIDGYDIIIRCETEEIRVAIMNKLNEFINVVRCKECKHKHYCLLKRSKNIEDCDDDDYCSYGERKANVLTRVDR